MRAILTPRDVDRIFKYPSGRAARLARAGLIPCIRLPDGEIRFDSEVIERLVSTGTSGSSKEVNRAD